MLTPGMFMDMLEGLRPREDPKDGSTFQSTLPVRGATPETTETVIETTISIHAPREGSDLSEFA